MKRSAFFAVAGLLGVAGLVVIWLGWSDRNAALRYRSQPQVDAVNRELADAIAKLRQELAALRRDQERLADAQQTLRRDYRALLSRQAQPAAAAADPGSLTTIADSDSDSSAGLSVGDDEIQSREEIEDRVSRQIAVWERQLAIEVQDADASAAIQQSILENADAFFPDAAPAVVAQCADSLCRVELMSAGTDVGEEMLSALPILFPDETDIHIQVDPDDPGRVTAYFARAHRSLPLPQDP